ncbi:MAG: twin transmembrane helix small protein [Alphaproteobacteria bacterium]|nr:twin transmembrane helix small protein [Alphaproteobacteria bacterium]MDE2337240.1 twin transmembrane helix small protein [Alphaproteobacteria bacterium]
MDKVFLAIACIAVLGVVFALFNGLRAMARGTEKDHKLSQKMMQMRVICQAIALIALFLAYAAKH